MPRIKDLIKWIFRRIKKIDDIAEFKVIEKNYYDKRMWFMADTIRIGIYERGNDRRVGVAIKHSKPDLLEFREFLSLVGAINYIQTRYPQDIYIYYYTKKR